jgi:hypothetical protein
MGVMPHRGKVQWLAIATCLEVNNQVAIQHTLSKNGLKASAFRGANGVV